MLNKDKILNAIDKDLLETEEFYIPIKKIWYWLKEEYSEYPGLKELTCPNPTHRSVLLPKLKLRYFFLDLVPYDVIVYTLYKYEGVTNGLILIT